MPDILGPLYEAVLAYCLRTHGVAATVSPPRPSPTCRETCPNAMECAALGHAPSIDVDPDVIGSTADNKFVVGFVTHWRTTGFEKKFWRTVEEIFNIRLTVRVALASALSPNRSLKAIVFGEH